MKHLKFADADRYPIVLLVKDSAFKQSELERAFVEPLEGMGISRDSLLFVSVPYRNNKAPVKLIKEYLAEVLPDLVTLGVEHLYCADANYFKVLARKPKAEAFLGYTLPCGIKGFEELKVTLGVNHKSLVYNPANEPKLTLSLHALSKAIEGDTSKLGADIIHSASYPYGPEQVALELQELHQYPELTIDFETGSLDHDKAGIGTVSFCWDQHNGIAFACDYQPFDTPSPDGPHGELVANTEVRALIKRFLESYTGKMIWHNCTYDLKVAIYTLWMKDGLDTPGLLEGLHVVFRDCEDTKVIAYLATNTTAGNKLSLKDLAHGFAGNWSMGEDIKDIRIIPLDTLLRYNLIDGLSTRYVYDKYYPQMCADNQLDIYRNIMMPSQKIITQMELTGMPLNPVRVQEVKQELQTIVKQHESVISSLPVVTRLESRLQREAMEAANAKLKVKQHPIEAFADKRYNPNSPLQTQKLLYEELDLPVIDFTDTKQPAVGAKTIKKLQHHTTDPDVLDLLDALRGFSKANKILSTFIPAFEKALAKGDGVVWLHGNFNLNGTKSGRLSSSGPNLQNLPSGSTYGKLIKSCFQAPDGWIFGGADFNSLEDYVSALTTQDPNKLKVYLDGYDGHGLRAFKYWPEKFPYDEITPELSHEMKKDPLLDAIRSASKPVTFALTYQGMYITLMNNCGFSKEEAKRIEANYHELYAISDQWVAAKLEEARKVGYVTVAFGLRLRTPLLAQTIGGHRTTPFQAEAEGRTAGNALGQSYGLLTNRSMNAFMQKVWDSPYRYDIKPAAMIHDANYFVFRDDVRIIEWINKTLIEEMQWQELPELKHDIVKLGAELDLYWPTWADAITLKNEWNRVGIRIGVANELQRRAA